MKAASQTKEPIELGNGNSTSQGWQHSVAQHMKIILVLVQRNDGEMVQ